MPAIPPRRTLIHSLLAVAGLLCGASTFAQDLLRIAYQTVVEPAKVAQADGAYERATGQKIEWRKFDSGADVITAIASGDIQIGYLTSSAEVAAWGAPTFDAWIVRKDYAAKHPEVVAQFVRVTGEAYAAYRKNPQAFVADPADVEKIVGLTGAKPEEIAELLAGSRFPTLAEQAAPALLGGGAGSGTVRAVAQTSAFLREQGKIDAVLASYQGYVTPRFVQAAAKPQAVGKLAATP